MRLFSSALSLSNGIQSNNLTSFCWPMAWRRGVETNGVVATPLTPARMLGQFIIISIINIIINIIIH